MGQEGVPYKSASDRYTLLNGVNEFLNAISKFLELFGMKYNVRNIRIMLSRNCKFRKNGRRKRQTLLPGLHEITPISVLLNLTEY